MGYVMYFNNTNIETHINTSNIFIHKNGNSVLLASNDAATISFLENLGNKNSFFIRETYYKCVKWSREKLHKDVALWIENIVFLSALQNKHLTDECPWECYREKYNVVQYSNEEALKFIDSIKELPFSAYDT